MALDYKKEYKDLYMPPQRPVLIDVLSMNFIMVDGEGDPNNNESFEEGVELLYGLSYTIKMSIKKGLQPEGYFEYVVPPLEGLWWIDGGAFSFHDRLNWKWTIMIRQPEFVTPEVFSFACSSLKAKKPETRIERARFEAFKEGLCVQMMHIGPFATEPATVEAMKIFMGENGLIDMIESDRKHHEIYLSDPRKGDPEKMKTVLRHPVEYR